LAAPMQTDIDVGSAIKGLEDIRSAALVIIVSSIVAVAGFAVGLGLILAVVLGSGGLEQVVSAISGGAALFAALLFVGLILSLAAIFAKFIPGLGKLNQWSADFSAAYTLVKIGMVGGLILVLLGLGIAIASAFAESLSGVLGGLELAIIGVILLLVGEIGVILVCFKLKDVFNDSRYLVAGILFILSSFIILLFTLSPKLSIFIVLALVSGVLSLIGWMLIYVAVPRSMAILRGTQPAPAQPAQMV